MKAFISAWMLCLAAGASALPTTSSSSSSLSNHNDSPRLEKRTCSNPAVHIEWRNLSDAQRLAYVNAEKCLMGKPSAGGNFSPSANRFTDLQWVHQDMAATIHNVGQFLGWHRYFLFAHETLLRTECGYTGPMTWWDETKDAGHFQNAPLFTSEYFGSAALAGTNGQSTCVGDGAFANEELQIGPGSGDTPHCLSRAINNGLSSAISTGFVNQCNSNSNFTNMWQCVFAGPHGYGHDAVGGTMSDVDTSPGDPAFFMHHAFIDHNYRIWQNSNPAQNLYQISGYTTQTEPSGGWQEVTLGYDLTVQGIIPDTTLQNVMDTEGGYLCYKYDY